MSPIPSIHTEEFDLLLNEIAADDCVREDDFVWLPMIYATMQQILCAAELVFGLVEIE